MLTSGGSLLTRTGLAQGQLCCPREPSLATTPTPSADCHSAQDLVPEAGSHLPWFSWVLDWAQPFLWTRAS